MSLPCKSFTISIRITVDKVPVPLLSLRFLAIPWLDLVYITVFLYYSLKSIVSRLVIQKSACKYSC